MHAWRARGEGLTRGGAGGRISRSRPAHSPSMCPRQTPSLAETWGRTCRRAVAGGARAATWQQRGRGRGSSGSGPACCGGAWCWRRRKAAGSRRQRTGQALRAREEPVRTQASRLKTPARRKRPPLCSTCSQTPTMCTGWWARATMCITSGCRSRATRAPLPVSTSSSAGRAPSTASLHSSTRPHHAPCRGSLHAHTRHVRTCTIALHMRARAHTWSSGGSVKMGSFVWHPMDFASGEWRGLCFGRSDAFDLWNPKVQKGTFFWPPAQRPPTTTLVCPYAHAAMDGMHVRMHASSRTSAWVTWRMHDAHALACPRRHTHGLQE